MTKNEMLWLLDMREELPPQFGEESRRRYRDTVKAWCRWVRDIPYYDVGTKVRIVNDIDLKDGNGRGAGQIGDIVTIVGDGTGHHGNGCDSGGKAMSFAEDFAESGSVPKTKNGITFVPNPLLHIISYSVDLGRNHGITAWWDYRCLKPVKSRKPCIYALVKSVYDSHFDTTEVRDVSLFKSWKSARGEMHRAYEKEVHDEKEHFVSGTGTTVPIGYAMARFSYDSPPLEDLEVRWEIRKAETGGIR